MLHEKLTGSELFKKCYSLLRKLNVHCSVQKAGRLSLSLVIRVNPVHAVPSSYFKIHFNIIFYLRLGLRIPTKKVYAYLLSPSHTTRLANLVLNLLPDIHLWGIKIKKPLNVQFPVVPFGQIALCAPYFLTPLSITLWLWKWTCK